MEAEAEAANAYEAAVEATYAASVNAAENSEAESAE